MNTSERDSGSSQAAAVHNLDVQSWVELDPSQEQGEGSILYLDSAVIEYLGLDPSAGPTYVVIEPVASPVGVPLLVGAQVVDMEFSSADRFSMSERLFGELGMTRTRWLAQVRRANSVELDLVRVISRSGDSLAGRVVHGHLIVSDDRKGVFGYDINSSDFVAMIAEIDPNPSGRPGQTVYRIGDNTTVRWGPPDRVDLAIAIDMSGSMDIAANAANESRLDLVRDYLISELSEPAIEPYLRSITIVLFSDDACTLISERIGDVEPLVVIEKAVSELGQLTPDGLASLLAHRSHTKLQAGLLELDARIPAPFASRRLIVLASDGAQNVSGDIEDEVDSDADDLAQTVESSVRNPARLAAAIQNAAQPAVQIGFLCLAAVSLDDGVAQAPQGSLAAPNVGQLRAIENATDGGFITTTESGALVERLRAMSLDEDSRADDD